MILQIAINLIKIIVINNQFSINQRVKSFIRLHLDVMCTLEKSNANAMSVFVMEADK